MKRFLLLAPALLLLSACSSVTERQENVLNMLDDAQNTASGTVQDVMGGLSDVLQKGKTITDGVNDIVDDAKKRIDQVQSGVHLMLDGKEMIEGSVK